jgi:hypothetical protein
MSRIKGKMVRCGVVWCGVVWYGGVWCGVVWFGAVWCGVVWYGAVWCGVVWCGVVSWPCRSAHRTACRTPSHDPPHSHTFTMTCLNSSQKRGNGFQCMKRGYGG